MTGRQQDLHKKTETEPEPCDLETHDAKPAAKKDRRKHSDKLCGDEGRDAFRSDACEYVRDRRWWRREC
jgi:hypothetical protein